jgi:hypothetical protein
MECVTSSCAAEDLYVSVSTAAELGIDLLCVCFLLYSLSKKCDLP